MGVIAVIVTVSALENSNATTPGPAELVAARSAEYCCRSRDPGTAEHPSQCSDATGSGVVLPDAAAADEATVAAAATESVGFRRTLARAVADWPAA